jgi:hypothetical protein
MTTTIPTPLRGEVWRIRFDPAEGDEIKKVRTAVVLSENAIGRLRLKIVVPISVGRVDSKPARRYCQCYRDLRGRPLSANPSPSPPSDRPHNAFACGE